MFTLDCMLPLLTEKGKVEGVIRLTSYSCSLITVWGLVLAVHHYYCSSIHRLVTRMCLDPKTLVSQGYFLGALFTVDIQGELLTKKLLTSLLTTCTNK